MFYDSERTSIRQIIISVKENVFLADNMNVVRRKLKSCIVSDLRQDYYNNGKLKEWKFKRNCVTYIQYYRYIEDYGQQQNTTFIQINTLIISLLYTFDFLDK